MGISFLFICRPVNLPTRVDRSRGKYRNAGDRALWAFRTCPPVDLSTCLSGLTGLKVNIYRSAGHYEHFVLVDLSTCLPGLTGQDGNI